MPVVFIEGFGNRATEAKAEAKEIFASKNLASPGGRVSNCLHGRRVTKKGPTPSLKRSFQLVEKSTELWMLRSFVLSRPAA